MKSIVDLRQKIDEIDTSILELFQARMSVADEVAAYKAAHKLPILDASRERQIIADRASRVPKDLETYTQVLFELLMEASRQRQAKDLEITGTVSQSVAHALQNSPAMFPTKGSVAVQGVEGSYQQLATDKLFRHANLSFYQSFEQVFEVVEAGLVDFGVLPIENSTAGSVNQVMDLMRKHNFSIVRTLRLKIDHNLMAKPGTKLKDIQRIYSHEQAIHQCERFLHDMLDVEVIPVENTAVASRMVAESNDPSIAAIASRQAASIYKLNCLATDIQDQDNNYTRFATIAKALTIYPGANRSTLMATVNNDPGSLYKVLGKFYALDINLIKLESRPIPNRDFEFMFYFDVDCQAADPAFLMLLDSLEQSCPEFRYLGSYTEVM